MLPISPGKFYGKRKRGKGGMSAKNKKARMSKAKRTASGKIKTSGRSSFLSIKRTQGRRSRRVTNGVSGLSHSISYVKSFRKTVPKTLSMISQPTVQDYYWALTFLSSFNQQGVAENGASLRGAEINSLTNVALQKYNYLGVASGEALQAGQRSYKMFLQDSNLVSSFTNQAPTSVEFDIYDLVSKVTSTTYSSPVDEWEGGIDDINQGSAASTNQNVPYASPFTSKRFNIAWKVVGKHTVELAAGRTHEHKFIKKINIPIDTEYSAKYQQIKGVTTCQLIVIRGGLGDSNNNRTGGTVGFTAAKLICMNRLKLTGRLVTDNPRIYSQVSTLVTAEPANVYVQDEGSGAVTDTRIVTTYA